MGLFYKIKKDFIKNTKIEDKALEEKQEETLKEKEDIQTVKVQQKKTNKRKTLVKEFDELMKQGNEEQIKQIFQKCDINAYGGYNKMNALGFALSEDLMIWLVQNGADVNYRGVRECTPLHIQANDINGHPEYLIRLGADIEARDLFGNTPLFSALSFFKIRNMKVLVEAGANVNAKNDMGYTPLLYALSRTCNGNIPDMLEIAEYLIEHQAIVDDKQREQVKRIGTDFEWYRNELRQEFIDEIEPCLMKLYKLYNVDPVPKRVQYDGGTITVKSKKWQEQHEELWQLLVPAKGHANTMQGEVIRISGRISYEILDNGRINWDKDYKKMTQALSNYLKMDSIFKSEEIDDLISKVMKNQAFEDELDHLAEMSVIWVLHHTSPIPLADVSYNR